MHEALYDMIFKRKSFHIFRGIGEEKLTAGELAEIQAFCQSLIPLCPDIKTAVRIVPEEEVTNRHGQEYCIAFYSEKKGNWLQNIGYMGQQLDLYLVSRNIGTCWYGIGKAKEETFEGLDYVIMIALAKVDDPNKFRRDMFKAMRKSVSEIWTGEALPGVTDLVRFAPSACNSQPWRAVREGNGLTVYRYKKAGKVGIMPSEIARYMNRIDMGIFLCFLELCLEHEGICFTRQLYLDEGGEGEWTRFAVYELQ